MSHSKIEAVTRNIRSMFEIEEAYLPVTEILEHFLPELLGSKYSFTVQSERIMGNRHGYVDPITGELSLRGDVYDGLCDGNGRDRFTACHEMGHYFLHRSTLNRAPAVKSIPIYRDPEWQANSFAAAILMPRELILECTSGTTVFIAAEFGVSLEAAKLRVRKLGLNSL